MKLELHKFAKMLSLCDSGLAVTRLDFGYGMRASDIGNELAKSPWSKA
jgi:hypothetical protein